MTHWVIHYFRQIWQIKCGQKGNTGLRHLTPSSCKRMSIRSCVPSRVLVRTRTLSGIKIPSPEWIRERWIGHHSNRNVLIRVMKIAPSCINSKLRVVKTSPKWIRSRSGGAQDIRPTSSGWVSRGLKWIRYAKIIGQIWHRGDRDIGRNLSTSLVVPSSRRRIRPGVKEGDTS